MSLNPDVSAVEANVRWSVRRIRGLPEDRAQQAEGRVKVVGAICDIETGRVRFLEATQAQ